MDYETNRSLNDVGVFITLEEAEELLAYLQRLNAKPEVQRVHLSQFTSRTLEREITFSLTDKKMNAA
jgi:hypothetical protein